MINLDSNWFFSFSELGCHAQEHKTTAYMLLSSTDPFTVFCAETTAAKNYYTMLQVAQILWILVCHGFLKRVYDWARRATEQGLARALWEGLRARRLPPDLPPIGQVRFGFT